MAVTLLGTYPKEMKTYDWLYSGLALIPTS